jgi:tRNA-dihydrouridine synthase B
MLKIGSLSLDFPVAQAALAGYSDLAMRRVARRHGALYTLGEVILDQIVLTPGRKQRRATRLTPDDHPIGGQIIGGEPGEMARAAYAMVEAGYDCIDINLACPVRKVLGRHRGGYLLSQPEQALAIVREVHAAVAVRRPVTVKLRRGMDDSELSERQFFSLLDGAFAIGVDAVTLHPRTVRQRYAGPSDWSFLKRVKRHVGDRVLIGSGDLFRAEDVVRMFSETGVDGVTLARGCIGNPWIFRDCRALLAGQPLPPPPGVAEQGETLRRHLAWSVEIYGERRACRIMRKLGIKYSELHPHRVQVRDAFVRVKIEHNWQALLTEWYDPAKHWPPVVRREGPGDLVAAGACD